MRADFSRLTFRPRRHYEAVLHQQGRVWLDSDWNEDAFERLHRLRQETIDLIGECGVPDPGTAFQISPNPDPNAAPDDFLISGGPGPSGRYYVDGLLCQLDQGVSYLRQPDLPQAPRIAMPAPGDDLVAVVYIEEWQRLITYLEDESIREIALGGPDTAVRLKTIAQVKVLPLRPEQSRGLTCGTVDALLPGPGKGTLTTLQPTDTQQPDLCRLPDPANYTGRENHLYRVEIHDPGDVRGEATGSATAVPLGADAPMGATSLSLAAPGLDADQAAAFVRAGLGILTDDDGRSSVLTIASASADGRTLALGVGLDAPFTTAKHATVSGGAARFKWSRDNAAFAVGVTAVSPDRQTLTLSSLGRDQSTALRQGDLVEISDEPNELGPGRGHLTTLTADPDPDRFTVSVADRLPLGFGANPVGVTSPPTSPPSSPPTGTPVASLQPNPMTLRRWDGQGWATKVFDETSTPSMDLGDGVHIHFGGSDLRIGDYWVFAARSADGSVEALTDAPPAGIIRHRCPLALVSWARPFQVNKDIVLRLFIANQILDEAQLQVAQDLLSGISSPTLTIPDVLDVAEKAGASADKLKVLDAVLVGLADREPSPPVFSVLSDCRPLFPPLTKLTRLDYVSGDGQEAPPGQALPEPLQVGVANGPWAVAGASVRFRVIAGNGVVTAGTSAGQDVMALTGADGVAECAFQLDSTTPSQRVEATLAGFALPVRFNASFSDTVVEERRVRVDGVFIENANKKRVPLLNDSVVSFSELEGGIQIACSEPVFLGANARPKCFVTADLPVERPKLPGVAFGYQPTILDAVVKESGKLIIWQASQALLGELNLYPNPEPNNPMILLHLTLKGNFIWAQADKEVFLDGDTFGAPAPDGKSTILRFPSGDGLRGGTFDMWFWLRQER